LLFGLPLLIWSLWALVGVGSMETMCCSFRLYFCFSFFFLFFSFCALGSFSSQSFLFVSFFFRCDLRRQEVIILVWQPSAFIFFFFFNSKSAFNLNTKKSIAATAHDDWRGLWEIDKIWKQYKIAWYNNMYI